MKNKIIGICVISAIILGFYFAFSYLTNSGLQAREGVVRYVDRGEYSFWGLETKKKILGIPVKQEYFRFSNTPIIYQLPDEFKSDGINVKVVFEITDVIGMSDWDVIIVPSKIEKITQDRDAGIDARQYLTDHIKEYAPQDPVLGGSWYVTGIQFEEGKNRALVDYEDGHIAAKAIVDFRIEQNNTMWASAIPAYYDDRERISAKVGDRFAIVLESNPSTGFSWIGEAIEDASRPLQRVDSGFISGAKEQDMAQGMVGIGGMDYIIYDVMNSGDEDIKFTYARAWESAEPQDEKTFRVVVE